MKSPFKERVLIDQKQQKIGFDALTPKQREVLDLLIEHKTSKEIARNLEISPHTVDQRINFAKRKLQLATRGELANAYRDLKSIYDQSIYEDSDIESSAFSFQTDRGNETSAHLIAEEISRSNQDNVRLVPEMFEGRYGTIMRLAAIAGLAASVLIIILIGLATFQALSSLMAR